MKEQPYLPTLNFNQMLADYKHKVEIINVEIKARQDVLQGIIDDINKKSAQRDAIILDFSAERQRLEDSWNEFHGAFKDYQRKQNEVNYALDSLTRANAQLEEAKASFVSYKASALADIDQKVAGANELLEDAKAKQADGLVVLQRVNDALTDLAQKKANLDDQVMRAQPLIDRAEDIRAQTEYNKTTQAENDAQALRNQADKESNRVRAIALNNQKYQLDLRETAVSQREKEKGG